MSGGKDGHSHCNDTDTALLAPATEKSWVKALKQFEINGKHKYLALTGAVILPMCFFSATMSIREETLPSKIYVCTPGSRGRDPTGNPEVG